MRYIKAEIEINNDKQKVFLDQNRKGICLLGLSEIEDLLNSQDEKLKEMSEVKKRNESLTSRILKLREENERLKRDGANADLIYGVCSVIQKRIDFAGGEPAAHITHNILINIKKDLQDAGYWRE